MSLPGTMTITVGTIVAQPRLGTVALLVLGGDRLS